MLSPKTFPLKDNKKEGGPDYAQKNGFAVFNVGELKQPVFLTPCADLVILRESEGYHYNGKEPGG